MAFKSDAHRKWWFANRETQSERIAREWKEADERLEKIKSDYNASIDQISQQMDADLREENRFLTQRDYQIQRFGESRYEDFSTEYKNQLYDEWLTENPDYMDYY